jgi:hypothetical protein
LLVGFILHCFFLKMGIVITHIRETF